MPCNSRRYWGQDWVNCRRATQSISCHKNCGKRKVHPLSSKSRRVLSSILEKAKRWWFDPKESSTMTRRCGYGSRCGCVCVCVCVCVCECVCVCSCRETEGLRCACRKGTLGLGTNLGSNILHREGLPFRRSEPGRRQVGPPMEARRGGGPRPRSGAAAPPDTGTPACAPAGISGSADTLSVHFHWLGDSVLGSAGVLRRPAYTPGSVRAVPSSGALPGSPPPRGTCVFG